MRRFSLIILSAVLALRVFALEVTCRPGCLCDILGDDASALTSLKILGEINASDFHFIDSSMPALVSLDLSEAAIAENIIPSGAFAGKALADITLPSAGSVAIGPAAFASTAIETLVIPASVVSVGEGAFSSCSRLRTVALCNSTLGGYTFAACPALRQVDLGAVRIIPEGCFAGCAALVTLLGSSELESIGRKAFAGAEALTAFEFGKKLVEIGDWAFAGAASMETLDLGPTRADIGDGAFFDCISLSSITLPEGVTSLPAYVFKGTDAVAMQLPYSLSKIGTHAMHGMSSLRTVDASALTSVPLVEADVWEGVDTSSAILSVAQELVDDFRAAPQWQDFEVRGVSTGLDETSASIPTTVSALFDGFILRLRSAGAEIAHVDIFNIDGVAVESLQCSGAEVSIDTSHLVSPLMIVSCRLADGSQPILKLIRTNG